MREKIEILGKAERKTEERRIQIIARGGGGGRRKGTYFIVRCRWGGRHHSLTDTESGRKASFSIAMGEERKGKDPI